MKHWSELRVASADEDIPIQRAIDTGLLNVHNVEFYGSRYPRETTGIYIYDPEAPMACHTPRWRAAFGLDTDHQHGPTCHGWHPSRYDWRGFKAALKQAADANA